MSARSALALSSIVFLVGSGLAEEVPVLHELGVRHKQTPVYIDDEAALANSGPVVGNASPQLPVRRIARANGETIEIDSLFVELCIGAIGFAITVLMQRIYGAKSKVARQKTVAGVCAGLIRGNRDKVEPMTMTNSASSSSAMRDGSQTPDGDDAKDADRIQKAEIRRLLASLTSAAKGKDVKPLVYRAIYNIEAKIGSTMNAKQVTEALAQLLRACASSKCFKEALTAFDCLEERVGTGSNTLWSLLLYVAADAGAYDRCEFFYSQITANPGPSGQDFVNVVRALAKRRDLASLNAILQSMEVSDGASAAFDRVSRNRALAACYKEGAVDLALAIAYSDGFSMPLDSVGYNTLITCFSRAADYKRSFAIFEEMEAKGVPPTEATFGALLEACCGAHDVTRALGYLKTIQNHGLKVNSVHCTTLIKALVADKRPFEAERLLDELSRECDVHPDIIVFYTLLKAFADSCEMEAALRVYESMIRHGVKPDEFVWNALINGCANDKSVTVQQFNSLMERFFADGLAPTTTTVSIILKALARCNAWDDALELLESAECRFKTTVETRLYVQLAQAAIKAGFKTKAMEVHDAMVATQGRRGQEGKAASRWLLRQCEMSPSTQGSK